MKTFILLSLLLGTASAAHWAVLICGSHTYMNYRHHADVCHAYQILRKNGIPESNIITMMYDDVPNASENPFPGTLFNKPSTGQGVNVYEGCNIDYRGDDVTAENVMNVLKGNKQAMQGIGNGKVLESTADDEVFLNFVDHGGVGILALPSGPFWYADQLQETLKYMSTNNMFKQLTFYVEACESGSMFDNKLPDNIKIYVTTAADPDESSWGTYCPPNDIVNGQDLHTCLGDLYSVNWMEDSDLGLKTETLAQQFTKVKAETTQSHVQKYGDMSFVDESIFDFQGDDSAFGAVVTSLRGQAAATPENPAAVEYKLSKVDSRDVALHTLFHNYARTNDATYGARLQAELAHRTTVDSQFKNIAKQFWGNGWTEKYMASVKGMELTQFDCMRSGNDVVAKACGAFSDYSLKYTRVVAHMCEAAKGDITQVVTAITKGCSA